MGEFIQSIMGLKICVREHCTVMKGRGGDLTLKVQSKDVADTILFFLFFLLLLLFLKMWDLAFHVNSHEISNLIFSEKKNQNVICCSYDLVLLMLSMLGKIFSRILRF